MPLSETERSLLDGVAAGLIVIERDRTVVHWNTWMAAATRRASADTTGLTLASIFPGKNLALIERAIETALTDGASTLLTNALHPGLLPLETRANRPLLHDVIVSPLLRPLYGCLVQIVDVTEATRRERFLRDRQNARYDALVDSAPDVILNLDSEGVIRLANPAAVKHFGYSREEMAGQSAALLFESERAWSEIWRSVVHGTVPDRPIEVRLRLKNGSLRYFEISVAAWKDGTRTVATFILRDIDDRHAAERALRESEQQARTNAEALEQLNEILEERGKQLNAMDRRKDEFLATLAHELRNPLAPLRNGLQLLKIATGDPALIERTRHMMDMQLAQMIRLIDDLLDVGRISNDRMELRKERTSLDKVIRQAVETSNPLLLAQQHNLTIELPKHEIAVDADVVRLTQVFSNLLNNAAKYTPAHGNIKLRAEDREGVAVVRVVDDGIGIPSELLPQIFEMFMQVDKSLERAQGGLGIGLSLVRRLTEMHGGTVEAFSPGPSLGSEFVVRLPIAKPAEGAARDANASGADGAPEHRRILVVDDNEDAAASLALLLSMMGHETRTAYNGIEALEVASQFHPHIALLDLGMPQLNGYETARRIRREPWGRGILLIAVSGWGQESDRAKSNEAGFNVHLVKPVDVAEIERVLTRSQ